MKRPVKLGTASLQALCAFVVLGAVAHAGMPYLPLIGPPPLRLEVLKSPPAAPVVMVAAAVPEQTNTNPSPVVASAGTASWTTNFVGPMPSAAAPSVDGSPDKALGDSFTASIFTMPTPDLLGISPQMLATFFRPVLIGTNTTVVAVPFPVSFTPPLPPDKSSHAEYNVK